MSTHKSAAPEVTWVGLDVHRDSITSAVLTPGSEVPVVDRWFHDEASVRRFVGTLGDPMRQGVTHVIAWSFCKDVYAVALLEIP